MRLGCGVEVAESRVALVRGALAAALAKAGIVAEGAEGLRQLLLHVGVEVGGEEEDVWASVWQATKSDLAWTDGALEAALAGEAWGEWIIGLGVLVHILTIAHNCESPHKDVAKHIFDAMKAAVGAETSDWEWRLGELCQAWMKTDSDPVPLLSSPKQEEEKTETAASAIHPTERSRLRGQSLPLSPGTPQPSPKSPHSSFNTPQRKTESPLKSFLDSPIARNHFKAIKEQNKRLQKKVTSLEYDMSEQELRERQQREEMETRIRELEEQLKYSRQERDALNEDLKAQTPCSPSHKGLLARIARQEEQIKEKQEAIWHLQNSEELVVEQLQKKAEIQRMSTAAELDMEACKVTAALRQVNELSGELEEQQRLHMLEVQRLSEEKSQLRDQVEELKHAERMWYEYEEKAKSLEEANLKLKEELAKVKAELHSLPTLQAQLSDARQVAEEWQLRVEERDRLLVEAKEETLAAKEELVALKAELAQAHANNSAIIAGLQENLRKAVEDAGRESRERQHAEEEISRLRIALAESQTLNYGAFKTPSTIHAPTPNSGLRIRRPRTPIGATETREAEEEEMVEEEEEEEDGLESEPTPTRLNQTPLSHRPNHPRPSLPGETEPDILVSTVPSKHKKARVAFTETPVAYAPPDRRLSLAAATPRNDEHSVQGDYDFVQDQVEKARRNALLPPHLQSADPLTWGDTKDVPGSDVVLEAVRSGTLSEKHVSALRRMAPPPSVPASPTASLNRSAHSVKSEKASSFRKSMKGVRDSILRKRSSKTLAPRNEPPASPAVSEASSTLSSVYSLPPPKAPLAQPESPDENGSASFTVPFHSTPHAAKAPPKRLMERLTNPTTAPRHYAPSSQSRRPLPR